MENPNNVDFSEVQQLRDELQKTQKRLKYVEKQYKLILKDRDQLGKEYLILKEQYEIISNAEFWKMTRPFRAIADFAKGRLVGFKPVRLIVKFIRYAKENGLRAAFVKMKNRNREAKILKRLRKMDLSKISSKQRHSEEQTVFEKDVCFSIVVPLYNTPIPFLKEMISSVVAQTYPKWELCLADGSDGSHEDVEKEVLHLAAKEPRIKYRKLEENRGISENTNECLKMSTGNYIALFDHDDILHPSALFEMMKAICEKDADYVYTDEVTFESPNIKKLLSYHFKPDFAIDNLRANNYICHFSAFSRELLDKAGYFRSEYDGSQDHDMILRLTSYAKNVIHIPKILYFWRSHPTSVAMDINSKPYAIEAGKRAVCDHIKSSGYDAEVESSRAFPTIYRIRYKLKAQTPEKVSIIIPNKNNARLIRRCIQSILDRTSYKNYEIVIVDSHSTQKGTLDFYDTLNQFDNVKVVNYDKEFNYSAILNFGAQFATGEYLVFLHSDVQIISRRWIEELLMYVQRDDVGIAGGMLYYPDETIQHAGIVLGLGDDRIAGHIFHGQSKEIIGYMGRACYSQNLSAVTSACMMVKTSVFVNIGGFNEEYPNKFSDVDFCLKVRQCGKLIVWTPYAEAIHLESRTREKKHIDDQDKLGYTQECEKFKAQWKDVLSAGDPYYNPNFSLDSPNFDVRVWSI